MSKKKIEQSKKQWLQEQSNQWVEQGIISSKQSQQIDSLYQVTDESHHEQAQSNWTTGILVALGAILIGGGVIMLFAHNWEYLGKTARTILSFLPLLMAQILCLYSFKKRPDSASWREASTTLTFMAIAASIALIGQTYHIYGDLERFVLSWFILGVPLAYLMRSNTVLILSTILIVWLSTFEGKPYWLLFLSLVPLWIYFYKQQRSGAFYWSTWLAAVSFAIALMISIGVRNSVLSFYPILFLLLMSSMFYAGGKAIFSFDNRFWKNPLSSLGAIGVGCCTMILCYGTSWQWRYRDGVTIKGFNGYLDIALFFMAIAVIVWILLRHWKSFEIYQKLLAAVGLSAIYAIFNFANIVGESYILVAAMNVFVLITSVLIIINAVNTGRVLLLNAGLLWLSSLIMLRFFDSDISTVIKGLAFIAIGSGFIGINIWFSRKSKKLFLAQMESRMESSDE